MVIHKCRYCGQPASYYERLTDEWYCFNCVEKAKDKWIDTIHKILDYQGDKNG